MKRFVLMVMAAILVFGPLTACGKKGALEPPPSAEEKEDE